LIFVLSPGSDPVSDYLKFWDEMNMSSKYQKKIISLGQGQGIHAENNIKEASQKGGWVLL
jgi:dynein heavy chain